MRECESPWKRLARIARLSVAVALVSTVIWAQQGAKAALLPLSVFLADPPDGLGFVATVDVTVVAGVSATFVFSNDSVFPADGSSIASIYFESGLSDLGEPDPPGDLDPQGRRAGRRPCVRPRGDPPGYQAYEHPDRLNRPAAAHRLRARPAGGSQEERTADRFGHDRGNAGLHESRTGTGGEET